MSDQLTPADAALLSRVLGHEIEPGLVRTLGPSTLTAIIQAARSEGPRPSPGVSREEAGKTVWAEYAKTQPGLSGGPDQWAFNAGSAVLALLSRGEG